jgi:hypothetical protein
MENNQSTIDFFNDFAKRTKRKIYTSETPYPGTFLYGVTNHKRVVIIPNTQEELSFLIGYHDPKSFDKNELFFGVFCVLNIPINETLIIRKKDIVDKLNPFLSKNIFKTDCDSFDSKTIISGTDFSLVGKYIVNSKTQRLILDSLNFNEGINVGINECNLDFVPAFKDKSNFGIFSRQKWIVDTYIIEELFAKIEQFKEQISKK